MVALFCVALLAHFYFATRNWTSGFMPGHEFRQAQTAIVSYYIDEQNNFSPLYETPILGKPWVSVLLEVPIYEWSVVLLSRAMGIPHFMAARTVSLTCFYLALPALYLLLGRLGLPRARRLLSLALILTCPVYIFYSRAFLMESMEIMCCAWFLLGFVRTMDQRSWAWLGLTIMAGTGAALIKSVTFAVWLVPAASYGVWLLWRDLRIRRGWLVPVKTLLWGVATVVVALGALRWWINLTDPIKAAHPSCWIFTSKNLSAGNWGILEIAARFSPKTWSILLDRWQEAIMSPWIIGLGLACGLAFCRLVRWPIMGLAAVFFLAQLMFPFAYAYQDYYYYACTIFLLGALGFVLHGVLDSRLPRWCCWLIIAVPLWAQVSTYWQGYRPTQMMKSDGGSPLTTVLRNLTPEGSAIIVAGADWAAVIPLYSQRKALMIRNGLEYDNAYLERAFNDLADENVVALVLVGNTRQRRNLIDFAVAKFGMDTTPTFSYSNTDVFCSSLCVDSVQESLRESSEYNGITMKPRAPNERAPSRPFPIAASVACESFANIAPAPFRAYLEFGLNHQWVDGELALTAHADTDLWLRAPVTAKQIIWDFGIIAEAYEKEGEKTDGAVFVIMGEAAGQSRQVFSRLLDPLDVPADRGRQHAIIPYQPLPGEVLQFSTRPNKSPNFDWAYWVKIEVQ